MSNYQKGEIIVKGGGELRPQAAAAPALKPSPTADDVKAMVEAQLRAAYEEMQTRAAQEIAEPEGLFQWDVLGFGPIQFGGPFPGAPPFAPSQVIRVNEQAFIVTVLVFGAAFTGVLTPFLLPVQITYSTGELKKWTLGPANLQHVSNLNLINGLPFLVDVFPFTAIQDGLFEMNIEARILDSGGGNTPPFAGFARRIQKIEAGLFQPQQNVVFDTGMKFEVYQ